MTKLSLRLFGEFIAFNTACNGKHCKWSLLSCLCHSDYTCTFTAFFICRILANNGNIQLKNLTNIYHSIFAAGKFAIGVFDDYRFPTAIVHV